MARQFNGTSDIALVTANLSGQSAVTVSAWVFLPANPASSILWEYSAGNDGFDVVCNGSTHLVRSYGAFSWGDTYPVASTGVWHQYVWVIRATNGQQFNHVWIDGNPQTMTSAGHIAENYTWTDTQLTIGGRVGPSRFTACSFAEFALWNGIASSSLVGAPDNSAKSFTAGEPSPRVAFPSSIQPTIYIPFLGDPSPEPDYSGNRTGAALTGTSYVNGPAARSLNMP